MLKNLIAIVLITYGLLGNSMFDLLDTPTPTPTPAPLPTVVVEEPSEEIKLKVQPIADCIIETDDRVEVALYFLELSKRLPTYKTITLQQLNDLVRHSAVETFNNRLAGKYDGFDEGLVEEIVAIAGEMEHKLKDEEKQGLSDLFEGIAWSLVQVKKG